MNRKVLLVEDDPSLGFVVKDNLELKGYEVSLAVNGEEGEKLFNQLNYDLCILCVMLPKQDGFSLAKKIREKNDQVPIPFVTAKSMLEDKVNGFGSGGDDYIVKPFSMEELIMRIEAILRRTSQESAANQQPVFNLGRYIFDVRKQTLTEGDEVVKLTTKEADLLKLLCQNANKILERNYALKSIWIDDNYFNARSMDVYITKLRKHLKNEPGVEIINVHGKGYKLII